MKEYRPTSIEDFEKLKKGDTVIVQWSDDWVRHTSGAKKVMAYNIHSIKEKDHEVICRLKDNHYFNYKMYLENNSAAEEVIIINK